MASISSASSSTYVNNASSSNGFSGMISFELDCLETAMNLLSRVKAVFIEGKRVHG